MVDIGYPGPALSKTYLAIFQVAPALMYTVDGMGDPPAAQAAIQRFLANAAQVGGYPGWNKRLESIPVLTTIYDGFNGAKSAYPGEGRPYSAYVAPVVQTSGEAQVALAVLRNDMPNTTAAIRALKSGDSQSFRDEVIAVRKLAGEYGPDPVLASVMGDVTQKTSVDDPWSWILAGVGFAAVAGLAVWGLKKVDSHERAMFAASKEFAEYVPQDREHQPLGWGRVGYGSHQRHVLLEAEAARLRRTLGRKLTDAEYNDLEVQFGLA